MTDPTFVLALLAGVLAALPHLAHARRLERPEILIALGLGIAAVIYRKSSPCPTLPTFAFG
jgi:hypothetical protein